MSNKVLIVYFFVLMAFGPLGLKASDWKPLVSFNGPWLFTVGDDPAWSRLALDVRDWDQINAPGNWERYYEGYNGYAWYRKNFSLPTMPKTKMVTLFLGHIDDVDEVFVNGQKVGQTGQFPPRYQTAYNQERQYFVPVSLLNETKNVVAVRVFDEGRDGGIVSAGKFGLYYDRNQELLELDLSGNWKFSIENFGNMHSPSTNDENWKNIYVPMNWEQQGFEDYDGRAWYRKRFSLPETLKGTELYLVLGRIDDFDKVYLNGQKIGQVEDLDSYSRFQRGNAWRLYRIYKIPSNLLKSKNLLSVEVQDDMGGGGIYEGPVGIMDLDKMREFENRIRNEGYNSGWDSFLRNLIRSFE
jgi:sialate O-acetylesterase